MDSSYLNASPATGTQTRVKDVSPASGMCPICIEGCASLCEIALSAFRGREALYPVPAQFGFSTAGACKNYGLDWSHFNILPALVGAEGVDTDPDSAIFPNVNVESKIGKTPLKMPVIIGAYGSTEVARRFWKGLAVGAALSGITITVGENVCGVDPDTIFENGKVASSRELKRRVDIFREFWDNKYGDIAVQTNVEDQRFGVDTYALSKLEVNIIERKWGQGAKAIGGEIRVSELDKAIELKKRGYFVMPDPEDKNVQEAFREGAFNTFERHSRVGMISESNFLEDVDWLRSQGAKQISLKTGAYRPAAVAFTLKIASEAKLDYVTFDGSEGGTGMSPQPMMNEMGIPTVYLEALALKCLKILRGKGRHIPDIIMAGGFINETQIFKSIALSNFGNDPYVKAILMGRAPLTAVMKSARFVELAKTDKLPSRFAEYYGKFPKTFFIKDNNSFKREKTSWEATGLINYLQGRIKVGLQQLMAGARKWRIELLNRNDITSLTERATKATGIPPIEGSDLEEVDRILS